MNKQALSWYTVQIFANFCSSYQLTSDTVNKYKHCMFSMELQIGVLLYIFFSSLQSQAKWPILSTKIDWMGQIKFMFVLEISPLKLFSHDELQLH